MFHKSFGLFSLLSRKCWKKNFSQMLGRRIYPSHLIYQS